MLDAYCKGLGQLGIILGGAARCDLEKKPEENSKMVARYRPAN